MKSESDNMGKRLYVTGNINALAKYLNMDEYKILSIFDFDARKTIEEIEKSTKDKKERKNETTNKSKAIRTSSKSI